MKFFLIALNITGAGCIVWFTVLINGFIPSSVGKSRTQLKVGVFETNKQCLVRK